MCGSRTAGFLSGDSSGSSTPFYGREAKICRGEMTCLLSQLGNYRAGKEQVLLFPVQSYSYPFLSLKLLVERSNEASVLSSLYCFKNFFIIIDKNSLSK